MTGSWPKIIRDPIHNIMPFEDTRCDRLLLALINTKEFQRLRRIKQLGLSQFVFPGADHSRFAHSIGVMQIARKFLERVRVLCPEWVAGDQSTVVLSAALLHDVGHGPFSHAFEKITRDKHERRTLEIIGDPQTDVNRVLRQYSQELPERLKVFFVEGLDEGSLDEVDISPGLTQIVSSQLDADRFDYLLRDSFSTGTDYGQFDLDWLLQHLHVDQGRLRFFLSHKAMHAAESYVFARYHMYRTVYFHKTTRAAEVMLRLLFRRFKELLADCNSDHQRRAVAPDAPPSCVGAFHGGLDLGEYLSLDDHTLTEFAKSCTNADDDVLQQIATGLLHRRLYKATDVSEQLGPGLPAFTEKCKEIIARTALNVDYSFGDDSPSDTPYKLYHPDAEKPDTEIFIADGTGEQLELSYRSDAVRTLAKPYKLVRYYYPESVRASIRAKAVPLLTGD